MGLTYFKSCPSFERRLKRINPCLRLMWSGRRRQFVIVEMLREAINDWGRPVAFIEDEACRPRWPDQRDIDEIAKRTCTGGEWIGDLVERKYRERAEGMASAKTDYEDKIGEEIRDACDVRKFRSIPNHPSASVPLFTGGR